MKRLFKQCACDMATYVTTDTQTDCVTDIHFGTSLIFQPECPVTHLYLQTTSYKISEHLDLKKEQVLSTVLPLVS